MKCNLLVFLLAAFFALPTMAQEMHVVTGKVVDSGGEPLIGAGVIAKDGTATIQGTVTDSEGKFSLSAPESATLHVSYIGYMTNIVRVGNRTRFDIILQEDQNMLDDVVVIGYGSQKKETLTGSISVVDNASLVTTPTTNLSNALVGRVPGISSLQSSGEPGDNFSMIRIRLPTPMPIAPPEPPSPMITEITGTRRLNMSRRLTAIASAMCRSSLETPGKAPGVSISVMIGTPARSASFISRIALRYPSGLGQPKLR